MENLIEGDLKPRQKVVVIEDLVSTGQSSLKAVEAIRQSGSDVLGMVAVFTYGFPAAEANMKEARVDLIALTNYNAILDEALKIDYIAESDVKTLQDWRKNPETWGTTKKTTR